MAAAEAVANGGVRGFLYGDTAVNETDFGPCFAAAKSFAAFVSEHRYLFGPERTRVADIALLYSIPHFLWISDSSLSVTFDYRGIPSSDIFTGFARVLEDNHRLYEVLICDHPSFSSFHQLSKLGQFRVAILPLVSAISDADVAVISQWTRAGGVLCLVDRNYTGSRDENYVRRPVGAFESLIRDPGEGKVTILRDELYRFAFRGDQDKIDEMAILSAITPPQPPVLRTAGLPRTVWVNAWRHSAGPMHSITFVNYDGNATSNLLHPVQAQVGFTLLCTDNSRSKCSAIQQAHLVTFDVNGTSRGPIALPFNATASRSGTLLSAHLPPRTISVLAVVVFSAVDELPLRAAAAQARKWLVRLSIAARSRGIDRQDYQTAIGAATRDLDAIQCVGTNCSSKCSNCSAAAFAQMADSFKLAVKNVTRFVETLRENRTASTLTAAGRADIRLLASATDSSRAAGWAALTNSQLYDAQRGYGWLAPLPKIATVAAVSSSSPDMLSAVHLSAEVPATFRLDLPHGLPSTFYDSGTGCSLVTIFTGSFDQSREVTTTAIRVTITPSDGSADTATLSLPGELIFSGDIAARTFRVLHGGGTASINITLYSPAHGSFYGDGYGEGLLTDMWLLNGVTVSASCSADGMAAVPAEGRYYLKRSEALAAAQLTDFGVVGPFTDDHFVARTTVFGPEFDRWNYSLPVTGAGANGSKTSLRWARATVRTSQGGPPTPLRLEQTNRTNLVTFLSTNIMMGVFLDDHDIFEAGLETWRRLVPAYVYLPSQDGPLPNGVKVKVKEGQAEGSSQQVSPVDRRKPSSYCNEKLGPGAVCPNCAAVNAAETAWHQGVDLYAEQQERLLAGLELAASYLLRNDGDGNSQDDDGMEAPDLPCAEHQVWGANVTFPMWEVAYNHYAGRRGIALPNTERLLARSRPMAAAYHGAWETVTHFGQQHQPVARAQPESRGSFGSELLLEDRLSTGLHLEEFQSNIQVVPGQWYRLVIKAMHLSWE
eukprot:g2114.t1